MASVPSTMLPLGTQLPSFELPDTVSGKAVSSRELLGGRGALVMFVCNHCPYVLHIRKALIPVAHEAQARGIKVVAINSNSARSHPEDGPSHMKALALEEAWRFPFLFDETQDVAKAFRAACTPDFFLFDGDGALVYRGQFDDSRPSKPLPPTGRDLTAAVENLLNGKGPLEKQAASIGCNIKWHPGNAPDYFTR